MNLPLQQPDWKPLGPGELWTANWPRCKASYSRVWLRGESVLGLELTEMPPMGLPFGSWVWVTGSVCRLLRKLGRRRQLWLNLSDVPQFSRKKFPLEDPKKLANGLSPAEVAMLRSQFGLSDAQIAAMSVPK